MKELQLEKLKIMLERHYANAPFHRARLDQAGIDMAGLHKKARKLEDLLKAIPIYDKQGYREHAEACDGDLVRLMEEEMPVSVDDLEAFHTKMEISQKIIWQEAGELERSAYKGKKFEKHYEEKD